MAEGVTAPTPTIFGRARPDAASIRLAIGRAADRTGTDFGYLLAQAKSESGLDPTARASTSSAGGLYQFIDQSWLGVLKQHGSEHGYGWAADAIERRGGRWVVDPASRSAIMKLRQDPDASALMAGEFAADNAAGLSRALGREPTSGDLYFAHFLGLAGATRFLKARDANPNATATAAFPVEARANRSIFYTRGGEARSLDQVYALMARKVEDRGTPLRMAAAPARLPTEELAALDTVRLVDVPPSDVAQASDAGDGTASGGMLALDRAVRPDVLRPTPQTAMLAYMMVSASLPTIA